VLAVGRREPGVGGNITDGAGSANNTKLG
jgi:hypothetical protein